MKIEDAIAQGQLCGGLWIPKTETHFVEMMAPTAKRHMVVDGKTAYQGHKWVDALGRFEARESYLDIGAHTGLWAWFLSTRFTKTYAIEAAPLHAALFRANFAANDDAWQEIDDEGRITHFKDGPRDITLYEVAVGAEEGTVSIECAADETGSAHVAQKGGGDLRRGHGDLVTYSDIPMIRVDDLTFQTKIDFCKIDVEGYELNVVKGAEQTFKQHKPWIVVEQKGNDTIYGDRRNAAVHLLESWGWEVVKVISGDNCMRPPA
jgi:FkbM family methyltransferase